MTLSSPARARAQSLRAQRSQSVPPKDLSHKTLTHGTLRGNKHVVQLQFLSEHRYFSFEFSFYFLFKFFRGNDSFAWRLELHSTFDAE